MGLRIYMPRNSRLFIDKAAQQENAQKNGRLLRYIFLLAEYKSDPYSLASLI